VYGKKILGQSGLNPPASPMPPKFKIMTERVETDVSCYQVSTAHHSKIGLLEIFQK